MDTQCAKGVFHSADGADRIVHADIPEMYLAVSTAADEFSDAPSLHVDVCNPLLVLFPHFDHGDGWLETLIVDADSSISKAGDENVSSDLI